MGLLAVSTRQVTKDGVETFEEPKMLTTLISCQSAEAATSLAEKAPAPKTS